MKRKHEPFDLATLPEDIGPNLACGTANLYVPKAQHDALKERLEEALVALRDTRECGTVDDPCWCSKQWRKGMQGDRHSIICQHARAVLKERPSATLQETKP